MGASFTASRTNRQDAEDAKDAKIKKRRKTNKAKKSDRRRPNDYSFFSLSSILDWRPWRLGGSFYIGFIPSVYLLPRLALGDIAPNRGRLPGGRRRCLPRRSAALARAAEATA